MPAEDAAPVAFANIMNGLIQVGLLGDKGKPQLQLLAVAVGLDDPKILIPLLGDACQVVFG